MLGDEELFSLESSSSTLPETLQPTGLGKAYLNGHRIYFDLQHPYLVLSSWWGSGLEHQASPVASTIRAKAAGTMEEEKTPFILLDYTTAWYEQMKQMELNSESLKATSNEKNSPIGPLSFSILPGTEEWEDRKEAFQALKASNALLPYFPWVLELPYIASTTAASSATFESIPRGAMRIRPYHHYHTAAFRAEKNHSAAGEWNGKAPSLSLTTQEQENQVARPHSPAWALEEFLAFQNYSRYVEHRWRLLRDGKYAIKYEDRSLFFIPPPPPRGSSTVKNSGELRSYLAEYFLSLPIEQRALLQSYNRGVKKTIPYSQKKYSEGVNDLTTRKRKREVSVVEPSISDRMKEDSKNFIEENSSRGSSVTPFDSSLTSNSTISNSDPSTVDPKGSKPIEEAVSTQVNAIKNVNEDSPIETSATSGKPLIKPRIIKKIQIKKKTKELLEIIKKVENQRAK